MAENPYAPLPGASTPPPPRGEGDVPSDVAGAVGHAWRMYWNDPVTLTIGVLLAGVLQAVPVVIVLAILFAGGSLDPEDPRLNQYVTVATVLGLFWSPLFTGGLSRFVLTAARGESAQVYQIFGEVAQYPRFLVWTLVAGGPGILMSIAVTGTAALGQAEVSAILGILASVVNFGVWIVMALGPITGQYHVIDRELPAVDAIIASWKEAEGARAHALVMTIAMTLVTFLGALACGVGACASAPIGMIIAATLYLQIRGRYRGE